ncbi:YacL family protein [Pasteurellaceae bacterium LIM206]|nr:YacL family protein [Pasteurellaceae bacterium LIM206]
MDYQFTSYLNHVTVSCSMGHEAVANWFNGEVRQNSRLISTALAALQQVKHSFTQSDIRLIGAEYSLFINADEVMVRANNLSISGDEPEMEEDFHYYDEESIAFCGLEDFERFLQSYLNFIA